MYCNVFQVQFHFRPWDVIKMYNTIYVCPFIYFLNIFKIKMLDKIRECSKINCSYNKRDTKTTMSVVQIVMDMFCMLLPLRKIAIHHMGKEINISYSTRCLFCIIQCIFSSVLPTLQNNKKGFQQSIPLLTFPWLHFSFYICMQHFIRKNMLTKGKMWIDCVQ